VVVVLPTPPPLPLLVPLFVAALYPYPLLLTWGGRAVCTGDDTSFARSEAVAGVRPARFPAPGTAAVLTPLCTSWDERPRPPMALDVAVPATDVALPPEDGPTLHRLLAPLGLMFTMCEPREATSCWYTTRALSTSSASMNLRAAAAAASFTFPSSAEAAAEVRCLPL
jgi:hypothetical protein